VLLLMLTSGMVALADDSTQVREFWSEEYRLTQQYESAEGPMGTQHLMLSEGQAPELLWITGGRVGAINQESATPWLMSFCVTPT
jgi:hypothetical protein